MYRNFPTPAPRLLDGEPRIVQPTLVKEFIRAVGPTAPRQHGDRINGESKVILASPQGILRHRPIPKQSDFHGGVHRLFQLGFHGGASTAFNHAINIHIFSIKCPFTRRNSSLALWQPICWSFLGNLGMYTSAWNVLDDNVEYRRLTIWNMLIGLRHNKKQATA